MSDESALLAALLAHPDEDTPRLMYADWLQENGNTERAEFIRLQCAPADDDAASDRADELEERNETKWLAGLPQFPRAMWGFRRGFPEYIDAPGDLFLERYAAFARVPWLRFLFLHALDNSAVRDFANREWSPRWVELEMLEDPMNGVFYYNYDNTPAIVAIANCPQVRQLRRLQLSHFDLTAEGLDALLTSPHLDGLKTLQITGSRGDLRFHSLRERFGDRLQIS